jgi:hypothetical protein
MALDYDEAQVPTNQDAVAELVRMQSLMLFCRQEGLHFNAADKNNLNMLKHLATQGWPKHNVQSDEAAGGLDTVFDENFPELASYMAPKAPANRQQRQYESTLQVSEELDPESRVIQRRYRTHSFICDLVASTLGKWASITDKTEKQIADIGDQLHTFGGL